MVMTSTTVLIGVLSVDDLPSNPIDVTTRVGQLVVLDAITATLIRRNQAHIVGIRGGSLAVSTAPAVNVIELDVDATPVIEVERVQGAAGMPGGGAVVTAGHTVRVFVDVDATKLGAGVFVGAAILVCNATNRCRLTSTATVVA
eukprot:NODE_2127_length_1198_cov_43.361184_g1762_i0.p2 GENE.NODE_2127_length_1198_cov_43.361184_g1762_i0~~NODE_2127_length_1198_cov_43.361184_g1762_i0.p2  ORF type:complete len:144 (-),score=17.53 NODE_2127_length_1198_cov_43.361184_g1762_i0:245-676(-)